MATDIIMVFGAIIFAILFAFLLFIAIAIILSFFIKDKYPEFEPNVSIIIPCFNEEKKIRECLNAVFFMDYPKEKKEIIVVNDGSTDNTHQILQVAKYDHPELKIIEGHHSGKSESLNLGLYHSQHDIIMCLDADTIAAPSLLKKLVRPLAIDDIGATNGSVFAKNNDSLIGMFQRIEYHYNNLIRKGFSTVFKNGIWFFGAFACYKKSVLKEIGLFKRDTMTEDMDIAMEIYKAGYRTINVSDAIGHTEVPSTLAHLFEQRSRWWIGGMQSLHKNRILFSKKSNTSILFLFVNQAWWTFYALLSFPLIAYQVYYWLPYNTETIASLFIYLFRWFSLAGPVYVLYMIPEWGLSFLNIFGVMAGIISTVLIIKAIYLFKDKLHIRNMIAIFFYFPYTIILNTIIVISLLRVAIIKKKYFIY